MNIYFYHISYSDYDDFSIINFYSTTKYSQEEFENIIYKAYKLYLDYLIANEEQCKCYPNIFINIDTVITEKEFNNIIEEISDLKVTSRRETARIDFGNNKDCLMDIRKDFILSLGECEECIIPEDHRDDSQKGCLNTRRREILLGE